MTHAYLALACLALLGVIAAQDYLYKPLRNETISAGLTGPYHWYLDASYAVLSVALVLAFAAHPGMEVLAVLSAVALLLVGSTNTFWKWWDARTGGKHSLWHSRFTIAVFVSALLLQVTGDSGWRWALTAANVIVPAAIYFYFSERESPLDGTVVQPSPAAEKGYVLLLCLWLIAWAL
jgi:hypothetical protein